MVKLAIVPDEHWTVTTQEIRVVNLNQQERRRLCRQRSVINEPQTKSIVAQLMRPIREADRQFNTATSGHFDQLQILCHHRERIRHKHVADCKRMQSMTRYSATPSRTPKRIFVAPSSEDLLLPYETKVHTELRFQQNPLPTRDNVYTGPALNTVVRNRIQLLEKAHLTRLPDRTIGRVSTKSCEMVCNSL